MDKNELALLLVDERRAVKRRERDPSRITAPATKRAHRKYRRGARSLPGTIRRARHLHAGKTKYAVNTL